MKFITLLRMPDKEPWMILIPALSGFIGGSEDVKNAILNGLHSNVNELVRLLGTSCGDKGCNDHRDQINTLNEKLNKLKNKLKDDQNTPVNLTVILSKCKLNGLDGPLKELKDAITEKIEKLNKDIESLKKADKDAKQRNETPQNASEIDKLNKDLQSHEASKKSLDTLNELCGYADKINKKLVDENPSTEILKSLCGGLEKFLGYDNGNYTGEGIVYSDLDRLCDGVMSFILQCLKGSQTLLSFYYPNITQTIKDLEGKIGKGLGVSGFAQAIGIVRDGLQGYEGSLNKKINAVVGEEREHNGTLKALKDTIGRNIKAVGQLKTGVFESNVALWLTTVTEGLDANVKAVRNATNALDYELRNKLKGDFEQIALQIKNLENNASRDQQELYSLGSKVQEELKDLEKQVTELAKSKQEDCIRQLMAAFDSNIRNPIHAVKANLQSVHRHLDRWSKKATKAVEAALMKCATILEKLSSGQESVKQAAEELRAKAQKLLASVKAAKGMLVDKVDKALTAAEKLETTLKTDLGKIKEQIEVGISGYVQGYLRKVQNKIGHIKGTKGPLFMGMEGIKERVKEYSTNFKTFGGTVLKVWVEDVVKSKPVKTYIDWYVRDPVTNSLGMLQSPYDGDNAQRIMKQLAENVASQIMHDIGSAQIQPSGTDIPNEGDKIEKHVEYVQKVCTNFADLLGKKLQDRELDSFLSSIANTIESAVGGTGSSNDNLKGAVSYALQQLVGAARGAAAELHSLALEHKPPGADRSILGKVDEVYGNANDISAQLDTALGGTGEAYVPGTNPEVQLTHNVNATIEGILNGQLPKDSEPRQVQLIHLRPSFTKPTGGRVGPNPKSKKEELIEAIDAIETEVEKDLDLKDPKDGKTDMSTETLKAALEAVNSQLKAFVQAIKDLVEDSKIISGNDPTNKAVKSLLNELNTMLDKGSHSVVPYQLTKDLKQICNEIATDVIGDARSPVIGDAATTTLEHIITAATAFRNTTIKSEVETCVRLINEKVTSEVKLKIDAIKKDALDRYVHTTTKHLEDLDIFIRKRNQSMDEIIHLDKTRGIKGFAQKLNTMFIPMIASFKPRESNTKFQDFANLLLNQFSELMQELHKQHDFKIMHSVVQPLWTSLGTLLSGLYTSKQFDHTFRTNLNSLREIVGNMSPDKHSRPSSVLLKVLQKGLTAMSQQLGYGYVSAYSERTWIDKEQRKYAKIIFTIFRILHVSLTMLKVNCKSLSGQQLNQSTDLGKIIADEGFNVSDQDGQNGELRNKQDCKGSDIINLLIRNVDGANNNEHLKTLKPNERNKFSLMSIIACLMSHLDEYNKVCHHSTISVKRSPCSVYEQLVWLIGLPHNQVFDKFSVYCRELFDKPKKDDKRDYSEIPSSELQLGAYPYTINYDDLVPAIKRVCQHSHRVLTTILGHGHSAGIYASDFSNNSLNFYYPSSMSTLVCMLLDVLKRIYYQLSFICRQCKYTSKLSGWRDCSYGRGVGGSNWQCNTLTYANQTCDQHCKQLANQCQPMCQANRQPKH
ncbi:hypothetical protein, conserved [Babesia ovata]|uniref:Extracellular matrix-binding ebh n=1 Tax=Babesia ovata TaxID=189622 RepID=A0A2H6KIZ1_9APIC|nr:uncharacterized protein BOVATA_044440 [Babesia ovata]GBE62951.1 hypothetical protein, conserved [Babesia ovata]